MNSTLDTLTIADEPSLFTKVYFNGADEARPGKESRASSSKG